MEDTLNEDNPPDSQDPILSTAISWDEEENKRIFRNRKLIAYKNVNKNFKVVVRNGICNIHRPKFYLFITGLSSLVEEFRKNYVYVAESKLTPKYDDVIAVFGYPYYEFFISSYSLEKSLTIIKNQNYEEISFSPLIPAVTSLLSKHYPPDIVYHLMQGMINKHTFYFTKTKEQFLKMAKAVECLIQENDKKLYGSIKFLRIDLVQVAIFLIPLLLSKKLNDNVVLTFFDSYICYGRIAITKYVIGIILYLRERLIDSSSSTEFINTILNFILYLDNPAELQKLIAFTFSLGFTKSKKILYAENSQMIEYKDEFLLQKIGSQLPKVENIFDFIKTPTFLPMQSVSHTYQGSRRQRRLTISNFESSISPIVRGKLLTSSQYDSIRLNLPFKLRNLSAISVYLLSEDGSSFITFFRKSKRCCPCMIVIQTQSKLIGCVFDNSIEPSIDLSYGSPLSTLLDFTNSVTYKASMKNNYFLSVKYNSLAIGGGKTGSAIYIFKAIQTVFSDPCETFDSPPLLPSQSEPILNMELYKLGF